MEELMRVLVLCNHWRTEGGIEKVVVDTVATLIALGCVVEVWSASDERGYSINGITSHALAPSARWQRFLYFRITWKLRLGSQLIKNVGRFDVVVSGHVRIQGVVRKALEQRPGTGVRSFLWVYGIEVWGRNARKHANDLRSADRVICISHFTAEQISEWVQPDKIVVIPPTVDTDFFKPLDGSAQVKKDEILIVGRLSSAERYKGHDLLMKVLPEVGKRTGEIVYLSIVGDGDDRGRLEKLSRSLGIANRV